MNTLSNQMMIFTVQMPENGKPIVYVQTASTAHRDNQKLAEELIRTWFDNNDLAAATDEEIESIAYDMRKDGYAWWNEEICFELSEVYS